MIGGSFFTKSNCYFFQIYQYVTNTKVFQLDLDERAAQWKSVMNLSDVQDVFGNYTVFGVLPTQVNLKRFKVYRGGLVTLPHPKGQQQQRCPPRQ
jgi:hypothetical protein